MIAIAIPAYQAAPTVGDVVRRCRELPQPYDSLELLVVDDGSTDDTGAVAAAAGARVVRLPVNQGKGHALATAFDDLLARGADAVVTLDADGQHLPEEIPRLLAHARDTGADLVLGTREHLFGEMCRSRRFANRLSSRAISWLAGCSVCDVQTGFRVYSARLLRTVGFPGGRFEAESVVVIRAARRGLTASCLPVRLGFTDGRSTSHFRPLADGLRIVSAVTRERLAVGARSA